MEATSEPEPAGEEKGSGEVGVPDKEEKVEQESQGASETVGEQKVLKSERHKQTNITGMMKISVNTGIVFELYVNLVCEECEYEVLFSDGSGW